MKFSPLAGCSRKSERTGFTKAQDNDSEWLISSNNEEKKKKREREGDTNALL